jgi:hypothetical protein
MPLIKENLAAELETTFLLMSTPAISANKMAMAYDNYCKSGLAGGIPPVFTSLEVKKLEATLFSAIASPNAGSPAVIAAAWSSGIQAYWMTPPVLFTAPPVVGAVTVVTGIAAVASGLTGIFSNKNNTPSLAANGIADILDVVTKTVLVTFTAPTPTPPIPATVM